MHRETHSSFSSITSSSLYFPIAWFLKQETTSLLTEWSPLVPSCVSLLLPLLLCHLHPGLGAMESSPRGTGSQEKEHQDLCLCFLTLSQFSNFC